MNCMVDSKENEKFDVGAKGLKLSTWSAERELLVFFFQSGPTEVLNYSTSRLAILRYTLQYTCKYS